MVAPCPAVRRCLLFLGILSIIFCGETYAGGFGVGLHGGYGILTHEEQDSSAGLKREAESSQNIILFGVSAEYSFSAIRNFYTGLVTDWALGLEDDETWEEDGVRLQANDLQFSAQFYDFRFGYKNSGTDYYYRLYVSGGWDGLHLKRDGFNHQGTTVPGDVTTDFSLWRAGVGAAFGYTPGTWAVDGRIAIAYFPDGEGEISSSPHSAFTTDGICLDMGIGIARKMSEKTSFYVGISYTLLDLDRGETVRSGGREVVLPESRTELTAGVFNIGYSF